MAENQNPSPSGPSEYEDRPAPGESPEEFLLRWVAPVTTPTPPLRSYADQLERWILADSEEERRAIEEEEKKEQVPKEEPSFPPDPWEPTVLPPSPVARPDQKSGKGEPPLALLIDLEEEEEGDRRVKIEEVEVREDALEVLTPNAHPLPIVEEVGSLSLASSQEEKESREAVKELEEVLIVQEQEGKRKVPPLSSPIIKRPAIMVVSPLPNVGRGRPQPPPPVSSPRAGPSPSRPVGRGRALRLPREYNPRRHLTMEDFESGVDSPFSPPEEPPVSEEYRRKWIEEEKKKRGEQSRRDKEAALKKKREEEAERRKIVEEKRKIEEEKEKLKEEKRRLKEMKEKAEWEREQEKKKRRQREEFEKWHNAYLEGERRKEEELKNNWRETTERLWREAKEEEKEAEKVRREIEAERRRKEEEERRQERLRREKEEEKGKEAEREEAKRSMRTTPPVLTPSARLARARGQHPTPAPTGPEGKDPTERQTRWDLPPPPLQPAGATSTSSWPEVVPTRGLIFGGLDPIPRDPEVDPPFGACFNCRQRGHTRSACPEPPIQVAMCYNCGRRGVTVRECPRCGRAQMERLRTVNPHRYGLPTTTAPAEETTTALTSEQTEALFALLRGVSPERKRAILQALFKGEQPPPSPPKQ